MWGLGTDNPFLYLMLEEYVNRNPDNLYKVHWLDPRDLIKFQLGKIANWLIRNGS